MVSVIIVNYNTFGLTCACIESVIAHTSDIDFEIILVDNASTECDPQQFKARYPQIVLVTSPVNGGFAKGNNLGILHAKGTIILLLNSDTYFTENSIAKAANVLTSNDKIGVLGVRMTFPDGRIQYTARKYRSIGWELIDAFRFVTLLLPYAARAKKMLGKYFQCDFETEADWVNGAFFMFRKNILSHLPESKLDERFFMYGEDQLWCYFIQQLGYVNYFTPITTIVHINNGSTKKEKQLQLMDIMLRNELEIMRIRKGNGWYYYRLSSVYIFKEKSRLIIKKLIYRFTGKIIS